MNNIENTPRREDEIPATQQSGNLNSNLPAQQGQGYSDATRQGGNQNTEQQADQSSTYRGQEGQEYDVDASDAINRQADYSGNSERDIEESAMDTDRDMESQHDSDQDINPGDKAQNKDFNR